MIRQFWVIFLCSLLLSTHLAWAQKKKRFSSQVKKTINPYADRVNGYSSYYEKLVNLRTLFRVAYSGKTQENVFDHIEYAFDRIGQEWVVNLWNLGNPALVVIENGNHNHEVKLREALDFYWRLTEFRPKPFSKTSYKKDFQQIFSKIQSLPFYAIDFSDFPDILTDLEISMLTTHPTLEALNLTNQQVTSFGLELASKIPNLKYLVVNGNPIKGYEISDFIEKNPHITLKSDVINYPSANSIWQSKDPRVLYFNQCFFQSFPIVKHVQNGPEVPRGKAYLTCFNLPRQPAFRVPLTYHRYFVPRERMIKLEVDPSQLDGLKVSKLNRMVLCPEHGKCLEIKLDTPERSSDPFLIPTSETWRKLKYVN